MLIKKNITFSLEIKGKVKEHSEEGDFPDTRRTYYAGAMRDSCRAELLIACA
jgi:hypothetical protein